MRLTMRANFCACMCACCGLLQTQAGTRGRAGRQGTAPPTLHSVLPWFCEYWRREGATRPLIHSMSCTIGGSRDACPCMCIAQGKYNRLMLGQRAGLDIRQSFSVHVPLITYKTHNEYARHNKTFVRRRWRSRQRGNLQRQSVQMAESISPPTARQMLHSAVQPPPSIQHSSVVRAVSSRPEPTATTSLAIDRLASRLTPLDSRLSTLGH